MFVVDDFFQLLILLKKNFFTYLRSWKLTFCLFITPFLTIFLVWAVIEIAYVNLTSYIVHSGTPPIHKSHKIGECTPFGGRDCYTMIYSPNTTYVRSIMGKVFEYHSLPESTGMVLENYTYLHDFMKKNANVSSIYIHFDVKDEWGDVTVNYTIFYNDTKKGNVEKGTSTMKNGDNSNGMIDDLTREVQISVDNAIISMENKYFECKNMTISSNYIEGYPESEVNSTSKEEMQDSLIKGALFAIVGTLLLQFSVVGVWIILLYNLMFEKSNRLRGTMELMGLKSCTYFLSWFIFSFIILEINVITTILTGYLFQLEFFLKCDFFVLFFLLSIFGFSVICLSFLISSLFSSILVAMILSFILCAFSFIINSLLNGLTTYLLMNYYPWIIYLMYWYPSLHFSRVTSDIAVKIFSHNDTFTFNNLFDVQKNPWDIISGFDQYIEPTYISFIHMFWNGLYLLLFASFFDIVLNDIMKPRHPIWFLFTFRFWGIYPKKWKKNFFEKILKNFQKSKNVKKEKKSLLHDKEMSFINNDVIIDNEIQKSLSTENEKDYIRIIDLNYIYNHKSLSLPPLLKPNKVHAVKSLFLSIKRGECCALLGHNGSGKTTTINQLIGSLFPTSGTAFIFGKNITFEGMKIRKIIGICPQHDILFENYLTAYQHLELFCCIKNIYNFKNVKNKIKSLLQSVGLWKVRNKLPKTFSGGMKRRLSIAIALVGDPEVLFLDEPTTGLDPKNRSKVWDLILKLKKTFSVILTTHSMIEADTLSDKISIMADGRLVVVGNSTFLKNEFGSGYNIRFVTHDVVQVKEILEIFQNFGEKYIIITHDGNSVIVNFPFSPLKKLIPLIKVLEMRKKQIKDFSINQTTLEEVFLKVTKASDYNISTIKSSSFVNFEKNEKEEKKIVKEKETIEIE